MSELAHFVLGTEGGIPVVTAAGEIDASNVAELRAALAAAPRTAPLVVVSLADVRYFDNRATYVLGTFAAQLQAAGRELTFVVPETPSARILFETTGFQSVCRIFTSVADAVRFASARRGAADGARATDR